MKSAAQAETGRFSHQFKRLLGRLVGLASVDLVLLKIGSNQIYPPNIQLEPYVIRSPRNGDVLAGGTLLVTGLARPVNNSPIIIELIDEQGLVVGSAQIIVSAPSGDQTHTPFSLVVPYTVTGSTPVRMTIRQESDTRILGTVALTSLLITLEP